ncbi:xanthine dehydrogenase family protein subunit M [bacterium]|nr:MAG: xanthine dehydrogenase family protein subunit M [bacterium]
MTPFELQEPDTLAEAITLLDPDDPAVRPLAGATALMLMMKAGLFQPTRLVSLRRLDDGLRHIFIDERGELHLGALATLSDIERSALVAEHAPAVTQACHTLSNVRVRNVATLGGHLAHGDPHMDLPPLLLALGARARAVGPHGERWIDAADLFVGYYQTSLERDELLSEIVIPSPEPDTHATYVKFTALSADDWPAVGVAAAARHRDGVIVDAKLAVSAATERPTRLPAVEAALRGATVCADTIESAAEAAARSVEPLADLRGSSAYKREMIRVHVRRALVTVTRS